MPKRFTDTDKWRKKFVKGLKANHKLLWFYILDDCSHAGIWHTDFEVASIRIGCNINEAEALLKFTDHVVVFDEGEKWFIPSFIEFQYGQLNPNNRANNSVIQILKKYKLIDYDLNVVKGANKHHPSTLQGVKDKDKDKDKVKVKEKDKDLETRKKEFSNTIIKYLGKYNETMLESFINYWSEHGENDKKMRFEKEKVFGISQRLSVWSNRDWNKNPSTSKVKFDEGEMEKYKI